MVISEVQSWRFSLLAYLSKLQAGSKERTGVERVFGHTKGGH